MNNETKKLMFSRKSDNWQTPECLFKWLDNQYRFTLDPAASDNNFLCDKYYTIKTDGLKQNWKDERVYINPPYSKVAWWVKKAYKETHEGDCPIVVMLTAGRVDTRWFADYVFKYASKIIFIKGRIKSINREMPGWREDGNFKISPAPFPSIVFVFNNIKGSSARVGNAVFETIDYKSLK